MTSSIEHADELVTQAAAMIRARIDNDFDVLLACLPVDPVDGAPFALALASLAAYAVGCIANNTADNPDAVLDSIRDNFANQIHRLQ